MHTPVVSSSFQQEQTRNWFEAKSRGEGAARSESRTRTVPRVLVHYRDRVVFPVTSPPRRATPCRAIIIPLHSRFPSLAVGLSSRLSPGLWRARMRANPDKSRVNPRRETTAELSIYLSFFFGNFLNVPRPVFLFPFRDSFLDRTFLSSSRSVDLFIFFLLDEIMNFSRVKCEKSV